MQESPYLATVFISLGSLLIAGLAAQWIGKKTAIPRVTLLITLGIAVGPSGFDLVSDLAQETFPWISHIALAMVGFLLGGKLHLRWLKAQGAAVISASIWVTVATWLAVSLAVALIFNNWPLALLLGAAATATDPAATRDVIEESNQSTPFTEKLLGIVALDDVWGLLIFSLSAALAVFLLDAHLTVALTSLWELGGAILLGIAIGLPIGWLTGRSSEGEPLLIEALGAVVLCAGLAQWLEVSYLLACITMGMTITNTAKHHNRPFHAIHQIEWPFMMLFFILAGASLDFSHLATTGWLGVTYVISRILGRLMGGWICCRSASSRPSSLQGILLGSALLPQAGVAIGIALIASQAFPQFAEALLTTAIAGTVVFELLGPPITRLCIAHANTSPTDESQQR
ncbi:cation:proton antiporter [Aurantivibrio plasticivorans]